MTKLEETRAVFESTVETYSDQLIQGSKDYILHDGHAYALQAHVQGCRKWSDKNVPVPEGMVSAKGQPDGMMPVRDKRCGDGWYCDEAREAWPELTHAA